MIDNLQKFLLELGRGFAFVERQQRLSVEEQDFYIGLDDNPTIRLILCSEPSLAVAKYSILSESKQLFSSKYLPFLPTIEELQRELENKRAFIIDRVENE